tara:strand:+ start:604 stop:1482 length:879 start_codon:yes stop_codon:yes gene_type:complete
MSYYDRLQKVIGEQEGGTGKIQEALDMAKERSQSAFEETQADAQAIMPKEINELGTIVGTKLAGKFALSKLGMPLLKKAVGAGREAVDASAKTAQEGIGELGEEAGNIFARGVTRMSRLGTDVTIRQTGTLAQPAQAFDADNPFQQMRSMGGTQEATTISGKRLTGDAEGEYGTEGSSGLTQTETARISDINEEVSGLGDVVGEAAGRTVGEIALDAIPVIGEVAGFASMLGEGIHKAVQAHKEQMADDGTERGDLQNVQAAQMYSGFNRPNFGSMALPSFDTSKSPALLQE